MNNHTSYGIFLLDNRIAERNIKHGRLEKKVYEEFLSSLPDQADACEEIPLEVYSLEQSKLALSGHFAAEEEQE